MEQFTLLGQFSRLNLQHLHHLQYVEMLLQGMITTHSRTWKEQFLQCPIKKSPRCLEEQVKLLWGKNIKIQK